MTTRATRRVSGSLLALLVLAFASANATHAHALLQPTASPSMAAQAGHAPEHDAPLLAGYACVSCNAASALPATASVVPELDVTRVVLRGLVPDVSPVTGVPLYRAGPERAPPASA